MRGDRLRVLREAVNLTQEQLALEVDSSEPQIWRYENKNSPPRADVLMRLAQFFNVSTDYLLGMTDNPAVNVNHDLEPKEAAVISAWRSGHRLAAVKTIVDDE